MGYTHYFGSDREFTASEWEKLTLATRKVLRVAQENLGIGLAADYDNNAIPIVDDEVIWFNGYGDEGHETFAIKRSGGRDFCKTARKPYDAPVVAVLLLADKICPAFSWASDGDGEDGALAGADQIINHPEFEGIS
jgi:hypothetical protein